MNEIIFQSIFDELQKVLPENWKRIALYANYLQDSYEIKYFVGFGEGKYADCFNIGNVSTMRLMKLFMEIDKILSSVRENLVGATKWNVLTMIIEADGSFKTDFDYTDRGENFVSYSEEWKKQYLK